MDNEFQEVFEIEEEKTSFEYEVIEKYFSILPKSIKQKLEKFIQDYDLENTKYNYFSVDFNRFLNSVLLEMYLTKEGTENTNFFNLRTNFTNSTNFWKICKEYVENSGYTLKYFSSKDFINVARKALDNADGFTISNDLYKGK